MKSSVRSQSAYDLVAGSQQARAIRLSQYGFCTCASPRAHRFIENQIRPFQLRTSDGESLYAWHILPLAVYTRNDKALLDEAAGFASNVMQTVTFKLLSTDPESRLVINCLAFLL